MSWKAQNSMLFDVAAAERAFPVNVSNFVTFKRFSAVFNCEGKTALLPSFACLSAFVCSSLIKIDSLQSSI